MQCMALLLFYIATDEDGRRGRRSSPRVTAVGDSANRYRSMVCGRNAPAQECGLLFHMHSKRSPACSAAGSRNRPGRDNGTVARCDNRLDQMDYVNPKAVIDSCKRAQGPVTEGPAGEWSNEKSPAGWQGLRMSAVPGKGQAVHQHWSVMPGLPSTPLRTGSFGLTGLMCFWSRSQVSTWSQIISPVSPGMLPGSATEAQPATL